MGAERETPPKPGWQRFLESTGGTALITVLLGGVLGQWISTTYQARVREREALAAREEALADRRFETHKELLAARLATVRETLELIGAVIAASEDLITITRPEWDPALFPDGAQREATLATKREIRETYNRTDARWRNTREGFGFLLGYYHGGDPAVAASWRELVGAVSAYIDCARAWYVAHGAELTDEPSGCSAGHRAAVDAIDAFVTTIGARETDLEVGTPGPERRAPEAPGGA